MSGLNVKQLDDMSLVQYVVDKSDIALNKHFFLFELPERKFLDEKDSVSNIYKDSE